MVGISTDLIKCFQIVLNIRADRHLYGHLNIPSYSTGCYFGTVWLVVVNKIEHILSTTEVHHIFIPPTERLLNQFSDFLTTTSRPTNLIIPTINNAKPKPKLSQSKLPPSAISLAVGSAEGSIQPKYLPNAECPRAGGGAHWTLPRNLLFEFTDYGLQGTSLALKVRDLLLQFLYARNCREF